jgi:hypothetical protein
MISKIKWEDARDIFKNVNPTLFKIIERIAPSNSLHLYKLNFKFGQKLLDINNFYIGRKNIIEDLVCQNNMIHDIVTEKSAEHYLENCSNNFSLRVYEKGDTLLFSYREIFLGNSCLENICSGLKSLFLLPKISNSNNFYKLMKAFNLNCKRPETYYQQYEVFKEIACSKNLTNNWDSEIILFSKDWFKKLNEIHRAEIANYFYTEQLKHEKFSKNELIIQCLFNYCIEKINIEKKHYALIKYFFHVLLNSFPGKVIQRSNNYAPIEELKKILIDIYGIQYLPTFVSNGYLKPESPIYFSLENPTTYTFEEIVIKNKLDSFREIKDILFRVRELSKNLYFHKEKSIYEILFLGKSLNFYYPNITGFQDPINALKQTFVYNKDSNNDELNLKPCESSVFLKGCIEVTLNGDIDDRRN